MLSVQKGSILKEHLLVLNMCVPKKIASKYIRGKLIELQREIDESTTKVGDFNTTVSEMDKFGSQKNQ